MNQAITIDCVENQILIKDPEQHLKSSQLFQLLSWGFKKEINNTYIVNSLHFQNFLPKLLSYLDKKLIKYILSESVGKEISYIQTKINAFDDIKKKAENFKLGHYSKSDFLQFVDFLSKNITRKLKDHQVKAAYHMYLLKNSANFSVPGSGKTSTVLSTYQKLKQDDKVDLLFVIGPAACFGPWKTEFESTLGYKPRTQTFSGGQKSKRKFTYMALHNRNYDLCLSTFQSSLNDLEEIIALFNREDRRVFLIVDEAHYIKQLGGSWASALLSIAEYAKYRCVLTGTPMPRSYSDVFNLFDFLWPGVNAIGRTSKLLIQDLEKRGENIQAREKLQESIFPLFYRVRKSDLGLKKQRFHPPNLIPMNIFEKNIYNAIESRIRAYANEDYLKNIEIVDRLRRGRIIRLRQCCSYPALLMTAIEDYTENLATIDSEIFKMIRDYDKNEIPAKLTLLQNMVSDFLNNGNKIIVWTHFIKTLKKIQNSLSKKGHYCKAIYGEIPVETISLHKEETREKIINEFLDPTSGLNIIIANPAACAESISLHSTCHHAIYYDLSYNCAQYLQSLDRIHRVGGSEKIEANYYFLQYENTIDIDIKSNLDLKAQRMFAIIEEDSNIYSLDMFADDNSDLEAYRRLFSR